MVVPSAGNHWEYEARTGSTSMPAIMIMSMPKHGTACFISLMICIRVQIDFTTKCNGFHKSGYEHDPYDLNDKSIGNTTWIHVFLGKREYNQEIHEPIQ